ncbi:MAG: glycosyltransferase [Phycisphaerae bacterium]
MLETIIQNGLIGLYVTILFLIAGYGLHRFVLIYLYVKHKKKVHEVQQPFAELPFVTVQLPMYNEDLVARRVIDATCRIDYPPEKFEIQVLDDSTDHSAEIAQEAVAKWAARGINIVYVHRKDRTGYKAGALAEGMKTAKGEFLAIFDADFIPPVDILHNVVNHFADPKIGMVQVRWDHLNRDLSLLTRGQAIFLDGHFVIEHTARNRSGRFMHFNGTAGVWRRDTINDAGGWSHDTLTEDLDLSYRAQLKGWQFIYLPQFCAPAELPPEIIAFKQQAHRWTKGSFQTAIKLLPRILRSPVLPWRIKTEAFFHLTNTIVYPLMVLLTISMYPAFIFSEGPLKNHPLASWLFALTLFVVATCSASAFFIFAQRELFGSRVGWRTAKYLPFIMALGVGISLNNARAVIEAIFTDRKKGRNEFVRTPKYGVTGKTRHQLSKSTSPLSFQKLALPILEVAFGCYMSCFIFIALYYQIWRGSVPFLCIFAGGYLYVGCSSVWTLWNQHHDRLAVEIEPEVEETPVISA